MSTRISEPNLSAIALNMDVEKLVCLGAFVPASPLLPTRKVVLRTTGACSFPGLSLNLFKQLFPRGRPRAHGAHRYKDCWGPGAAWCNAALLFLRRRGRYQFEFM